MLRTYGPLLFLWLAGFSSALVLAVSKGQESATSQKERQLQHASQLSSSLRIGLENFSDRTANDLARIIEVEIAAGLSQTYLLQSPFASIALLQQGIDGRWSVEWSRSKEAASATSQYEAWLPRLPLASLRGEQISWSRVELPGKRPSLVIGLQLRLRSNDKESLKVALGQLPLDYLSPVTDSLKSDDSEIFLVDSSGFSLTFPDPQYVGSQMDVHPIVSLAVKSQKLSEYGDFRNLMGAPTVGGFERAKNSNVFVITNLKVAGTLDYTMAHLGRSVLVLIGLLLFLTIPLWLIRSKEIERIDHLKQTVSALRRAEKKSITVETQPGESRPGASAAQIFEKMGRSFFNHLKSPVYSSLGKLQQLKSMSGKNMDGLADGLSFMEKELRRIRDFIEALSRSLNLQDRQPIDLDLVSIVEAKLAQRQEILKKRNIEFEFFPHVNSTVRCQPEDLRFIVESLLDKSISLLSTSVVQRKLSLRIESAGPVCRLAILLSGLKMGSDAANTFFDIQNPEDMEMSFAKGYAVSWGGNLFAEDSMVGFRIFLELPLSKNVALPPEEPTKFDIPSATVVQSPPPDENILKSKKIESQNEKAFPPVPSKTRPEVSVVEELTVTTSNEHGAPEVKIRKPKVRSDV